MEIILAAFDTVNVKKTHIKPHRRIERSVLIHAKPAKLVIKGVVILLGCKITVAFTPVGNCFADPVNKLFYRMLSLACLNITVEILAGDNLGGQLAP